VELPGTDLICSLPLWLMLICCLSASSPSLVPRSRFVASDQLKKDLRTFNGENCFSDAKAEWFDQVVRTGFIPFNRVSESEAGFAAALCVVGEPVCLSPGVFARAILSLPADPFVLPPHLPRFDEIFSTKPPPFLQMPQSQLVSCPQYQIEHFQRIASSPPPSSSSDPESMSAVRKRAAETPEAEGAPRAKRGPRPKMEPSDFSE
jgi:hypothetical protein